MGHISIIKSILWKINKQHYSANIKENTICCITEICSNVFDIEFRNGRKRIINPLEVNFTHLTPNEFEEYEKEVKRKYEK